MKKSIGIHSLLDSNFKEYDVNEKWKQIIGTPEQNFRMLIWGASGSGKTTFALQMLKYLTEFGKVYYNSVEQGKGKSLQQAAMHCKMDEIEAGKFMIGDRDPLEDMIEKIKKTHPKFICIDSLQYINLTKEQYKRLIKLFPTKSFVIISWEDKGEQPKGQYAQDIRYMVDIKCYVRNKVAKCDSRFGPTVPYQIMPKKAVKGAQVMLGFEE